MTTSENQKIIDSVIKGIAIFSSLDATEITLDDNLEEDLYLDLAVNLPLIIAEVAHYLEVEILSETISDYVKQALKDPEKATVSEVIALFEEEMEFN